MRTEDDVEEWGETHTIMVYTQYRAGTLNRFRVGMRLSWWGN